MFRSSVFVTLLSLFASALGFIVQLLIARRFAVGVEVDAYLFALSVPTFISGMLSAMLSYTVVPRIVACENDAEYHLWYVGSIFLLVAATSLFVAPLVGGVLGTLQSHSLPYESPIRQYGGLPLLVLLAWLIGACQIILGCLSALLNSTRKYLSCAAIGLLPYLGMVILLSAFDKSAGITVVPIGMLTGTVVAVFAAVFILRAHLFPLPWKQPLWSELRRLAYSAPYAAIAMTCFSSYAVIDAYWAPRAGDGVLASLGYAQRLVIAFGSLVVVGPSAVLVPRMAAFVQKCDYGGFIQCLLRALWAVGGIGVCLALLFSTLAEPLVKLLFARGNFGDKEIFIVSDTLRHMSPGLVAMLVSVILMRAIFCFTDTAKIAAIIGALWTGLYFFASSCFYTQGAVGLASAYSLAWIIFAIVFAGVLLRIVIKKRSLT